jgi:hypothetical protein
MLDVLTITDWDTANRDAKPDRLDLITVSVTAHAKREGWRPVSGN